jgi:hypothetical protein
MEHRIFGPIESDESDEGVHRWTGRVEVLFFSTYDMAAAYEAEELRRGVWSGPHAGAYSTGEFDLWLISPGPARGEPSRRQEKAFLDFLGHRDEICNRVVDAIYGHYRCHWGDWREPADLR